MAIEYPKENVGEENAKIHVQVTYRQRLDKEYFLCSGCELEVGLNSKFCQWCGCRLPITPNLQIERKIV